MRLLSIVAIALFVSACECSLVGSGVQAALLGSCGLATDERSAVKLVSAVNARQRATLLRSPNERFRRNTGVGTVLRW